MVSKTVELSEDAGVLTVTFDRDDKLNALGDEMVDALANAAERLASQADTRVLVIRSIGRYFTAGVDLQSDWSRSLFEDGAYRDIQFRHRYRKLHRLFDEFEAIEKPIVLAAQGPCLGVGVEMATSCDFRLASTEATFAVPEVRFNSVAGSGGVSRLTRVIGPSWAKWLSMAGQTVDADTALRIGLVTDVVPAEQLDDRVTSFARELAALPAEAMGLTKLLVDAAVDTDRVTARHLDRLAATTLLRSDQVASHRAGFAAKANEDQDSVPSSAQD